MKTQRRLYNIAFGLALFTIIYNVFEGILATYLGFEDESLALFGFGSDSFIEVISGIGIAFMILRIQKRPESQRAHFERTALKITGIAFYILVLGLTFSAVYALWSGHTPATTFWGVIISISSILVMWILVVWKKKIGHQLHSTPLLADANCTKICVYMSVILLLSSAIYELTAIQYIDSIGTLGLSYFAFKEGKECFEKVKGNHYCGCP
ncbi:cation transporter [Arenibacter sp. GZD96]|uniref:cation transporter n=1 Tax=Aurantibrevibacter litoralis TaxID=3106030 RepID=UPI002B003A9B|nr:cation transporter [Arenibacter sp. GZD-96]MEA1784656.1 cation transporter [Arenibacter sp. GZD-96]